MHWLHDPAALLLELLELPLLLPVPAVLVPLALLPLAPPVVTPPVPVPPVVEPLPLPPHPCAPLLFVLPPHAPNDTNAASDETAVSNAVLIFDFPFEALNRFRCRTEQERTSCRSSGDKCAAFDAGGDCAFQPSKHV